MSELFSETVTVFNFYEQTDGSVIWYPHILQNVHAETDRGALIKKIGADGNDKIEVHVSYTENNGVRYVQGIQYLTPKEWKLSPDDALTFNPENDFFMLGSWDGDDIIYDADYSDRRSEGFYAYMNNAKDDIYKITKVQRYNVIKHFEILGA